MNLGHPHSVGSVDFLSINLSEWLNLKISFSEISNQFWWSGTETEIDCVSLILRFDLRSVGMQLNSIVFPQNTNMKNISSSPDNRPSFKARNFSKKRATIKNLHIFQSTCLHDQASQRVVMGYDERELEAHTPPLEDLARQSGFDTLGRDETLPSEDAGYDEQRGNRGMMRTRISEEAQHQLTETGSQGVQFGGYYQVWKIWK